MPVRFTRRHIVQGSVAFGLYAGLPLVRGLAADETMLAKAKRTGEIAVGIANERPYGYVETDGKVTGAIVEVIRAALAPSGVGKISANVVDFNSLIPGLNAGRFDIIGAGMYIRPARCKAIAFTNPVTRSGGAFIAKKGNPTGVHSLKDVANSKAVRIATQTGSSQVDEVKQAGIDPSQVILFAKDNEAVAGLQAGRADVVYFPDLEVNTLLATTNDPSLERVAPYDQILDADGQAKWNYQSLGLRKADADLKAALDKEIAVMLASGALLKTLAPYGYTTNELPTPDATTDKLCAG